MNVSSSSNPLVIATPTNLGYVTQGTAYSSSSPLATLTRSRECGEPHLVDHRPDDDGSDEQYLVDQLLDRRDHRNGEQRRDQHAHRAGNGRDQHGDRVLTTWGSISTSPERLGLRITLRAVHRRERISLLDRDFSYSTESCTSQTGISFIKLVQTAEYGDVNIISNPWMDALKVNTSSIILSTGRVELSLLNPANQLMHRGIRRIGSTRTDLSQFVRAYSWNWQYGLR